MPSLLPIQPVPKENQTFTSTSRNALAPAISFTLSPYSWSDTIVTPTTTAPEAEEEITADPANYQNLVSGISDFSFAQNITKYAYSTDDGATWTDAFVPFNSGGFLATGDGQIWSANSDPVVANDGHGNVYLSSLYIALSALTGQVLYSGLYVAHATRAVDGSVVIQPK